MHLKSFSVHYHLLHPIINSWYKLKVLGSVQTMKRQED